MMNNNNNNNLRVYTHETEICHNGRLGCWVRRRRSVGAVVRAVAETALLLAVIVAFAAVCAMA